MSRISGSVEALSERKRLKNGHRLGFAKTKPRRTLHITDT